MIDSQDMVKKVFTQKSGRVETNKGEEYYNSLFEKVKSRLSILRAQPALKDTLRLKVRPCCWENGAFVQSFLHYVLQP